MRFYLFPLFSRQWNEADPAVYRIDLLWPIFTRERDNEGGRHTAFRPILDLRRTPEWSAWTVGLGLAGRTRRHGGGREERIVRLLWAGRVGWQRDGAEEIRWRDVWPVLRFEARRTAAGTEHGFLRVPYLLPLRGLEPDGWDRHYNKLFELYGARWRGDERRSSLLFGLLEARDSASESWRSWAGLLHWRQ
jgi:hypothetical protein